MINRHSYLASLLINEIAKYGRQIRPSRAPVEKHGTPPPSGGGRRGDCISKHGRVGGRPHDCAPPRLQPERQAGPPPIPLSLKHLERCASPRSGEGASARAGHRLVARQFLVGEL